jgi:hypothetical protein
MTKRIKLPGERILRGIRRYWPIGGKCFRAVPESELRQVMQRLATAEEGLGAAYSKGFADGAESIKRKKGRKR